MPLILMLHIVAGTLGLVAGYIALCVAKGARLHRASGIGVVSLTFGVEALTSPSGTKDGTTAFPYLMFGVVGLVAGALDVRMMRAVDLRGAPRLARHLWRMCFALFIAALSFFLGQADEFPDALRRPALLAIPVLVSLLAMLHWLWRVRVRPARHGMVRVHSHGPE